MTSDENTQNEPTSDEAATPAAAESDPSTAPAAQQPTSAVQQDDGLADSLRSIRGVGESRTGVDADDA